VSEGERRGVLYVATGEKFVRAACTSADSVSSYSPRLKKHIFCDGPSAEALPRRLFDSVGLIDDPHRRSKVDHLHRTPFAKTLYLDADTALVAPVDEIFDLLDRFDIALAHAPLRNIPATKQFWKTRIPDSFPQMNSGVIAYRSSPPVLDLLRRWHTAYREAGFKKDQVTLREILWKSDLRLAALPPEYNIRHVRLIEEVWRKEEAKPRILHCRNFVARKPKDKTRRRRIKGWFARRGRYVKAIFAPVVSRLRELVFPK
jgi:hypothetical protein